MKFLFDNLYLVVLALVSGGLLLWPLLRRGGGSTALTPLAATQAINHRNAVVVDVREEPAFAAGSLAGARNIPFAKLGERASELARFKGRPAVVVCDSGQQSEKALAILKAQGFEEAYTLAGGVAAWKQAGLPLVQATRDNPRPPQKDSRNRSKSGERGGRGAGNKPGARVASAPAGPPDAAAIEPPAVASEPPASPAAEEPAKERA